jgi:hypothetical protein
VKHTIKKKLKRRWIILDSFLDTDILETPLIEKMMDTPGMNETDFFTDSDNESS